MKLYGYGQFKMPAPGSHTEVRPKWKRVDVQPTCDCDKCAVTIYGDPWEVIVQGIKLAVCYVCYHALK